MNIEEKVMECICTIYEVEPDEVSLETDIREDLSAQSIKLIGFVGALEDTFGIMIDFQEAGGITTIGDFVKLIKERV